MAQDLSQPVRHFFRSEVLDGCEFRDSWYPADTPSPLVVEMPTVSLTLRGEAQVRMGTATYQTFSGQVQLHNIGSVAGLIVHSVGAPMFCCSVAMPGLSALGGAPRQPPDFECFQPNDPCVQQALLRLFESLDEPNALWQQSAFAWLQRCLTLHTALPARPRETAEPAAVARMKDYLHEHLHLNVSLADLARLTGLSRWHALETFKRHVGLPPHAYQVGLRVARARTLLRAGVSVGHTEAHCGFADQAHLTRVFRRQMRVTPAAYARGTGAPGTEKGREHEG